MAQAAPQVELRDVEKSYLVGGEPRPVLRGVSLSIQAGSFVAIVGPSGSGKSTLLNVITGLDHADSGQVTVVNGALNTMDEEELAAWRGPAVGIVFQFFQLLPGLSLIQNVMLPMDLANRFEVGARRARAVDLLAQFGLAEHADKLPNAVSGGQQQRAAIARALANDPPLIVADEPTGNLDSETAEQTFALLERLVASGKTVLMVTHNDELAARAGRTIALRDGEIVGDEGASGDAGAAGSSTTADTAPNQEVPGDAGRLA